MAAASGPHTNPQQLAAAERGLLQTDSAAALKSQHRREYTASAAATAPAATTPAAATPTQAAAATTAAAAAEKTVAGAAAETSACSSSRQQNGGQQENQPQQSWQGQHVQQPQLQHELQQQSAHNDEQQQQQQQQQFFEDNHHQQQQHVGEQLCEGLQQHAGGALKRRRLCVDCGRPVSVCYCSVVAGHEVSLSDPAVSSVINGVLVFLHPLETKRKNSSLPILRRLVKGIQVWPHRRPGCCPFATQQQHQEQQEEQRREQKPQQQAEATQSSAAAPGETPSDREGQVAAATGSESREAHTAASRGADTSQQGLPQFQQQPQQQHLCTREGTAICDTSNMLLLFPTDDAFPLSVGALPLRLPVTLLVIDGTWTEAKEMLKAAQWLQQIPAVRIPPNNPEPLLASPSQAGETDVPAAAAAADSSSSSTNSSGSSGKNSAEEALRVSGVYGRIRTPPARVAASGGVCTAEAVAKTLAVLGRWGRSSCPELLHIDTATRATLQHIVSQQQMLREISKK